MNIKNNNMAVQVTLPQPKRIVVQAERAFDATGVNVYSVTDNLTNAIIANVDFGTSDSAQNITLWDGDEYTALTTFSKQDAIGRLFQKIAAM